MNRADSHALRVKGSRTDYEKDGCRDSHDTKENFCIWKTKEEKRDTGRLENGPRDTAKITQLRKKQLMKVKLRQKKRGTRELSEGAGREGEMGGRGATLGTAPLWRQGLAHYSMGDPQRSPRLASRSLNQERNRKDMKR